MKAMRKQLLGLAVTAAAAMGLASCSNDMEPNTPQNEGMVDVTMTTSLPQALQTYALNSAEGGLANIENESGTYAVRYIMEVYPKYSTELAKRVITYKTITKGDDSYKSTTFSTRLVAAEYNFVFWADIVRKATAVDANVGANLEEIIPTLTTGGVYGNRYLISKYSADGEYLDGDDAVLVYGDRDVYAETTLQSVCISNAVDSHFQSAIGEMNDAYRNVTAVDLRTDAPVGTITLTRPFAKLRVVTTDKEEIDAQNIDVNKITVNPAFSVGMPSTINVLTGKTSGSVSQFGIMQKGVAKYAEDKDGEYTIAVWYCLAPQNTNTDVDLSLGLREDTHTGNTVSVASVPLVENKLTTIKGKLFSRNAEIQIEIKDELEEGDEVVYGKEADTPEALIASLSGKTEQIKYTGKVTKAEGLTLDFTTIDKYAAGNNAILTLDFPNMDENAVITILGGDVMPKTIVLNNSEKCSLRVNAEKTEINLGGSSYGMLVYNCSLDYSADKPSIDVFFPVNNGIASVFGPTNRETYHRILLNTDFTLPADAVCKAEKLHADKTCNYIETVLKPWLDTNTGKTVWDFVGAAE